MNFWHVTLKNRQGTVARRWMVITYGTVTPIMRETHVADAKNTAQHTLPPSAAREYIRDGFYYEAEELIFACHDNGLPIASL